MTNKTSSQSWPSWQTSVLLGLLAFSLVLVTTGSGWLPWLRSPGITSDEPFNVLFGRDFVAGLLDRGVGFFSRQSVAEVFESAREHPPLGRWLIGWSMWVLGWDDLRNARIAPAAAFGFTVFLVSFVCSLRYGRRCGVYGGLSLMLLPRVFGHAHFAALDTFVAAASFAALVGFSRLIDRPGYRSFAVAAAALGAALLVKIHGVLIFPIAALALLGLGRWRLSGWYLGWAVTGMLLFCLGWPWLWFDSWDRLAEYLGRTTGRLPILVTFPGGPGGVYRDVEVPWYYPATMFIVTIPVGLLLFTLFAFKRFRPISRDPLGWTCFCGWVFPLALFSLPGVPVYDGVRLFLMVFPCWAVFAGLGADRIARWLAVRCGDRLATGLVTTVLLAQGFGLLWYHPFHLSYYNALVGGLRGASRVGFEITYWGDAISPDLVNFWSRSAAPRSSARLVPSFYEEHGRIYETEDTRRRRQSIVTTAAGTHSDLLLFRRKAYLDEFPQLERTHIPLRLNSVDGVWISGVFRKRVSLEPQMEPR